MPVSERLMYRAINAHAPLTEMVVVSAGRVKTTARAAAVPFFAGDSTYVGTAIYFQPTESR